MAAHGLAHGRRKGGHKNVERHMDQNWRTPPRSGSPGAPLVNGSTYPPYKKESPVVPAADQEYKQNVEFLRREWKKVETERKNRTDTCTITEYVERDQDTSDFQPFNLDDFLVNLHQHRQQQQQQQ